MRGTASLRQPILPGPAGTGCGRPMGIDQWCAYHQIPWSGGSRKASVALARQAGFERACREGRRR